MSAHRENEEKIYVCVRADHLLDGRIRPLMFRAQGGPVVRIDRITDVREAPSLKAGGQGMRYTCLVEGQQIYLFHDDLYWFIEAGQADERFTPSRKSEYDKVVR
ncbi:MAG TPA: hypothetical protein IAC19_02885 [Candidatus Ventricola gallistercoris]|nr:hypothetical protein [Candidatus Ventricola gallistercoris]